MSQLHFHRHEFKYHLPTWKAQRIIKMLQAYMAIDKYVPAGKDHYPVHSIYFDSPHLKSYFEKIFGFHTRQKVRIRSYHDHVTNSSDLFLEVKTKQNFLIKKDRLILTKKDVLNWYDNHIQPQLATFTDQQTWHKFNYLIKRYTMKPKLMMSYKRMPFVEPRRKDLRITFDFDLRADSVYDLDFTPAKKEIYPNMMICELKFNNTMPEWLQQIIKANDLKWYPYSKYCRGQEANHALLPNIK